MKAHPRDIRSIQFKSKENILAYNNFQNVRAGQKPIQKLKLAVFSIIVGSFLSLISGLSSGTLDAIDSVTRISYSFGFTEIISTVLYFTFLALLVARGFEVASSTIIAALMLVGIIVYTLFEINLESPGIGCAALLVGLSIFLAWLGAAFTGFFVALTSLCFGSIGEYLAIMGYGLTVGATTLVSLTIISKPEPGEGILLNIAGLGVILAGAIIARRAVKGVPEFAWLRRIAVFWAATGGTSFYGADLTDACFDGADLRHTDLRKAILTRASFKNVTGLDLSRLQGTILEPLNVRKLLTNPQDGCGKDYTGTNLSGANLRGANLEGAIFTEANLNGADLREAKLEGANLVKAQVLDTNFSEAYLTDACIQEWNINSNTGFKDVKCERVYLKQGKHGFLEPKPDIGEFEPGEFEKWIEGLQETVDVILHAGFNLRAFVNSLAKTSVEQGGLDLSRYSIESKGDGIFVAKVGVSKDADKPAIHQTITNYYYNELSIQGERTNILINPTAEVEIMESKNENTTVSGDMVSGNKTTSGDVTIGDVNLSGVNLTNSSMALVNLNSQVSNTIQQLQDASTDKSDELAKILTDLQKSIADDAALSESQKKEALEAVETIAEEGKKPPEERTLKYCSMAVNALKGVASAVTDASKLAEVLKTYLPTLTTLLGM
jgi:uncharacterized protein YjbI with pentapeptide repeats